ncbi:acyl-CoA synthetase family member 2, mitochondrial [Platysternon megacephalum]|uniref:Acyl-CoA synthetase family member 2, mitochondrial n=1 Tax=Platysternon megacephalum TaxID=55544 RepID=A0A4D9E7E3_9SAUR|nr:acyl-CoA synthetase family member 2, mitochondrial [Platysternon megacephalum]
MGLLRIMLPPKLQLLAVLTFGVVVLFLENQIQKLEESRGKLDTRNSLDTRNANVRSTLGVGENEKEEERRECLKGREEKKRSDKMRGKVEKRGLNLAQDSSDLKLLLSDYLVTYVK